MRPRSMKCAESDSCQVGAHWSLCLGSEWSWSMLGTSLRSLIHDRECQAIEEGHAEIRNAEKIAIRRHHGQVVFQCRRRDQCVDVADGARPIGLAQLKPKISIAFENGIGE